jgi:outer membrane lipase/esterase
MKKLTTSLAAAVLATTCLVAPARAGTFYAFGDSLVDNGNTIKFTGFTYPPAPYSQGRFSNGEVWAQYFPGLTGLSFTANNDYGVGGAFAGPLSVLGTSYNNLESLPSYLGEAGLTSTLPSFLSEVTEFQATGTHLSSGDVVGVWVGANDYFATLALVNAGVENGATAVPAAVELVAQQTTQGVDELAQLGGRRFVVFNLPNLGETPEFNTDSASIIAAANAISAGHNSTLAQFMNGVHDSTGANVIVVNEGLLFNELLTNAAAFGITNTTQACISVASCVSASTAVQNHYLFWDAVHPTTGTHLIIAEYAADLVNELASNAVPAQLGSTAAQGFTAQLSARLAALQAGASGFSVSLPDHGVNATVGQGGSLSGFITGGYGYGTRNDVGADNGFKYNIDSVTAGVDKRVTDGIALGAAVGYSAGHANVNYGGTVTSSGVHFGAYASFYQPQFYLNLNLGYGVDSYKTTQSGVLQGAVTARPAGNDVSFGADTGYIVQAGTVSFGPIAGLHLTNASLSSYTQTGDAGLTQQVSAQTYNDVVGNVGLAASAAVPVAGAVLYPQITGSWDHLLSGNGGTFSSVFTDEPTVVLTNTYPGITRNWGVISGSLSAPVTLRVSVSGTFSTTVAKTDGENHEFSGAVHVSF